MIRKFGLKAACRFTTIAAFVLAVCILNIGCGSDDSDSPAGETPGIDSGTITITYPNATTVWQFDENPTHVEWTGATGNTRFDLYKGDTKLEEYHRWTANDGRVDQNEHDDWTPGTDYSIKATDENGNWGWSESFTIRGPAGTHSISGTVSGAVVADVSITLSGYDVLTTTTDDNGDYSFSGLSDGTYTVIPELSGYTFTQANETVFVTGEDVTEVDFVSASDGGIDSPVLPNPLVYEAEDYTNSYQVNMGNGGSWYSGTGYVSFQREDAWFEWGNVEVTESGFYKLRVDYAYNRGYVPPADIFVNGMSVGTLAEFLSTGDWETVGSVEVIAKLNAGANTVRIHMWQYAPSSPNVDKMEISSISDLKAELYTALNAVNDHITGAAALSDTEFADHKAVIDDNMAILGEGEKPLLALAFQLVENYESTHGPMFLNDATKVTGYGWDRRLMVPDMDTTTLSVMQGIVDHVYRYPANITNRADLIDGFSFQCSSHFPGEVTAVSDPNEIHTISINCKYPDVYGRKIAFEDDPARKPTGLYVAPGSVATVTFPAAIVGKGFQIRVGAHARDHKTRPFVRRLDRVSVLYDISRTEMKVANPLGGGIYIEVPYLADEAVQDIQVKNVVRAPFFSLQDHHQTTVTDWQNNERGNGAPWADFKTEKFQFQVPTSWIYAVDDPESIMRDWDKAMDVMSDVMGFPRRRGKELLYLQLDVMIKGPAGSIGYPQINHTYSAYDSFTRHNGQHSGFLKGPEDMSNEMEFHELGHALGMQKFPGENESVNNILFAAVLTQNYGYDFDDALRRSRRDGNTDHTMDTTAVTWMTSKNFKLEQSMVKLEMQYQLKGHARYMEIARLFSWDVVGAYWRSIIEDEENGVEVDRTVDGLILRMSKSVGVDVTPLMQFWGVQPEDADKLMADTAAAGLQPSAKIYDMLVAYKALIPADNAAFQAHALAWWKKEPETTDPRYVTEYDHNELFETYDEAYAADLHAIMQQNIDTYFPGGRPR